SVSISVFQEVGPSAVPASSAVRAGPTTCSWRSASSGPLNCATTPSAREARISPTGALLKNFVSSLSPVTPGSDCASSTPGKVPAAWKEATSCLAWLSQSASSAASLGCFDEVGTVRNVPPQFDAPPGKTSAKSQPLVASPPPASTWPFTTPSIQPGQTKTAKVPSTKALPLPQSHWAWLAERPAFCASASCSQKFSRVLLPSMLSEPSFL